MKNFQKTILNAFFFVVLLGIVACSSKDDVIGNLDGTEQSDPTQTGLPQVNTDWNTSMSAVESSMTNYILRAKESDFLSYETADKSAFVSYKFKNDALIAAALMAPSDGKLDSYIDGYNYYGNIGNSTVYNKDDNNTILMNYVWKSGENDYTVIGFAPKSISSDMYQEEINDGSYSSINSTPLTLEAITDGTITFKNSASGIVTYKINGGADNTIGAGTTVDISVTAGQKITLFGDNATYYDKSSYSSSRISSTCDFYAYGNIMSLIYSTNFATATMLTEPNTFEYLFYNNTHLRSHPSNQLLLPATTLSEYCYYDMFRGCTGLTTAPALPATTLAGSCYGWMFCECTSLTSAPALPAKKLAGYCYVSMFNGCTSLTTAPELPATNLTTWCYWAMFEGCTSLTSAPALPATTLTEWCYREMFNGCTNLTSAPDLPATRLANESYDFMFYGCTNLNKVKCLAKYNISGNCEEWLYGVASGGTFTKASGVSWTSGRNGIPYGWTVLEE